VPEAYCHFSGFRYNKFIHFLKEEANMKRKGLIILLILAVLATTLACGLTSNRDDEDSSKPPQSEKKDKEQPEKKSDDSPSQPDDNEDKAPAVETDFPLPPKAKDVMTIGEGMLNYQVKMSMGEVMDFYRTTLTGQGLTEREILTVKSDTTFSMAFDGSANGKAIVIQGVDLGNGQTNVNIRFEDV
jgi:hypothetical protein